MKHLKGMLNSSFQYLHAHYFQRRHKTSKLARFSPPSGSIRVGFLQAAPAALRGGERTGGGGATREQAEPAAFGLAARKPLQPPWIGVSRRRAAAAATPLSTELFSESTNNPQRKLWHRYFITMTSMIPPKPVGTETLNQPSQTHKMEVLV